MNIGIVGHEASKFTAQGEVEARAIITQLLSLPNTTLVSGGCHLGGIDIWAEEIADQLKVPKIIHLPSSLRWSPGYKERNLLIAKSSHALYCIAVAKLPISYKGMRFDTCYHCRRDDHVKGGGCWTMKHAKAQGKRTHLFILDNL